MVKLTPELLENSRQFINAIQDRELDLRGYKIPAVENLGATYNQFDTIDFSDNDLKKLENFPLLPRLKSLILHNNRISLIQADIGQYLPCLHTLILTNNGIKELGDLDPLATLPKLEYLCLRGNDVAAKPQYRFYVIYKAEQIRVLDYKRIKQLERDTAKSMFKGKKGRELRAEVVKTSANFQVDTSNHVDNRPIMNGRPLPSQDIQRIKTAIASAKSLDEVERLQQILQSGEIPGKEPPKAQNNLNNVEEEQEEEEEEEDMEQEQEL